MSLKKRCSDGKLRRAATLALAAGLVSLAFSLPARAALGTGEITADQVNIRSDTFFSFRYLKSASPLSSALLIRSEISHISFLLKTRAT